MKYFFWCALTRHGPERLLRVREIGQNKLLWGVVGGGGGGPYESRACALQ